MTVLTEAAQVAAEIDAASARADLQAAEAKLDKLSMSNAAYAEVAGRRRWALARLEVATK